MGNCCGYWPYRPTFCQYFLRRHHSPILLSDVDTLMDLDYLEEPQLRFRINETPFTVSSYLNWVSNKPRSNIPPENMSSGESSLSCRRGTGKRQSFSRLIEAGGRACSPPLNAGGSGTVSDSSQYLLFTEVDPKGRPPPPTDTPGSCSPPGGNWTVVTSVSGSNRKASTSAVFCPNSRTQNMSRSLHTDSSEVALRQGGGKTSRPISRHEEEMDGPEIARLMRRLWPRDLNFFGSGQRRGSLLVGGGNGTSSAASSATSSRTSLNQRPTVLDLRKPPSGCGGDNLSEMNSFATEFESSVDLDWDHEPNVFTAPASSKIVDPLTSGHWYTSPFESATEAANLSCHLPASRRRNNHLTSSSFKRSKPVPANAFNHCGGMVDSGFAGAYDSTLNFDQPAMCGGDDQQPASFFS